MKKYVIIASIGCAFLTGCVSVFKGDFILSSNINNKGYVDGNSLFQFNNESKTFKYFRSTEKNSWHSSGKYIKNNNIIVLNSDTNINALPVHIDKSKINSINGRCLFQFKLPCVFNDCKEVKYTLILNDSISYPINNSVDTLGIISIGLKNFKLKIDLSPHFYTKTIQGSKYYSDSTDSNLRYFTQINKIDNINNMYSVVFDFNKSFIHYETFRNDSLVIFKKNTFKLSKYNVNYRKK